MFFSSSSSSSRFLWLWWPIPVAVLLAVAASRFPPPVARGPFKFIHNPLASDPSANRNAAPLDLEALVRDGAPSCVHPRLIRGAFNYPPQDLELCKANNCSDVVRQRLLDVVGDNTIQAYPMEILSKPLNKYTRHDGRFIESLTVRDYLTHEKYDRWVVHTQTQVGNWDEYRAMLDMKGANALAGKDTEFDALIDLPNRDYIGSFVFFSRGTSTGSHMHYAIGSNIVFHMSGVKRWIVVSPEYWGPSNGANCSHTPHGGHGICFPNGYTGEEHPGTISIDKYRQALIHGGVPEEAMLEFDIYPGDIFINCEVWPHAVENLTPESTAWTLRYAPEPLDWDSSTLRIYLKGVVRALRTALTKPQEVTMFGAMYDSIVLKSAFLDHSEKYSGNSFREMDQQSSWLPHFLRTLFSPAVGE